MAGWTGFEPATSSLTGWCSNQLNYHPEKVIKNQYRFFPILTKKKSRIQKNSSLKEKTRNPAGIFLFPQNKV